MSQPSNEIKLPDGIAYSLHMLSGRVAELTVEKNKIDGAVASILAPYVPPGENPSDWLIQIRPDQSVVMVKRLAPKPTAPAIAEEASDVLDANQRP